MYQKLYKNYLYFLKKLKNFHSFSSKYSNNLDQNHRENNHIFSMGVSLPYYFIQIRTTICLNPNCISRTRYNYLNYMDIIYFRILANLKLIIW